MDLWIRSQDRECLMKVDRVDYDLSSSQYKIMVNGYETLVATYKTKERALEVLDEIQEILKSKMVYKNITKDTTGIESINQYFKNNIHFNTNNNADIHFINNTYVYEMPKE